MRHARGTAQPAGARTPRLNRDVGLTRKMSNREQVLNDLVVHQQAMGHDARNRELLLALARHGVDLNAPRSIDLFFVSQSELGAVQLSASLQAMELVIARVGPRAGSEPTWSIEARTELTPKEVAAKEYTRSLVRLALAHESEYDGWATQI